MSSRRPTSSSTGRASGGVTATAAARRPAPEARPAAPTTATPNLTLVDRRSLRSARVRRTLLFLTTSVLVVALFAVGLIHAQLVQRQQRLDDLRTEISETRTERLRLARDVVVASSPEEIVRRARAIGMVRAEDPVYLVAVRPAEQG